MAAVEKMINKFGKPITIIRMDGPSDYNDDGEWVDGTPTAISLKASIQPMKDKDRELLPEGTNTEDALKLYTIEKIETDDEDASTVADMFTWNGKAYKVISARRYQMGQLDHYRSVAALSDKAVPTVS